MNIFWDLRDFFERPISKEDLEDRNYRDEMDISYPVVEDTTAAINLSDSYDDLKDRDPNEEN